MKNNNIILIGPSGVGKSEWAKAFAGKLGYEKIEVDEKIGKNPTFASLLENIAGADEAEKMGNFFGKPWENPEFFWEQEQKFLEVETEEMQKISQQLQAESVTKNTHQKYIIDLTGSAIYCPNALAEISQYGTMVYLQAGKAQYDEMQKNFLEDPKPVTWGRELLDLWKKAIEDENLGEKLPELYGKLLDSRHILYKKSADVIIEWEIHREKSDLKNPQSLQDEIEKEL